MNDTDDFKQETATACTPAERELLDQLYKDHPELKCTLDFDGYYCDWDEIINIFRNEKISGMSASYAESPKEMIFALINERDDLLAKLKAGGGE